MGINGDFGVATAATIIRKRSKTSGQLRYGTAKAFGIATRQNVPSTTILTPLSDAAAIR